jgi:hypothetical protein
MKNSLGKPKTKKAGKLHQKAVETHRSFLRSRRAGMTEKGTRTASEILEAKPVKGQGIMSSRRRRQMQKALY